MACSRNVMTRPRGRVLLQLRLPLRLVVREVDGVHELGLLALALVAQLVVEHVLVDDAVHVRL